MSAERLLKFRGSPSWALCFCIQLHFQTLALQFEFDRGFALSRPDGIVR